MLNFTTNISCDCLAVLWSSSFFSKSYHLLLQNWIFCMKLINSWFKKLTCFVIFYTQFSHNFSLNVSMLHQIPIPKTLISRQKSVSKTSFSHIPSLEKLSSPPPSKVLEPWTKKLSTPTTPFKVSLLGSLSHCTNSRLLFYGCWLPCPSGQDKPKLIFLMAHNWQKWKSRFLACPWHKML